MNVDGVWNACDNASIYLTEKVYRLRLINWLPELGVYSKIKYVCPPNTSCPSKSLMSGIRFFGIDNAMPEIRE